MTTPPFDTSNLDSFSQELYDDAAANYPQLLDSHIQIADALEGWKSEGDSDFDNGYNKALREVSANLRQCDFIPGNVLNPAD